MFQKPAFGANTSGFGMQSSFGTSPSTAASPFGSFKPTTGTSAFGAPPAFGASTSAQPTTGGGLFGSTNTTGGLFGASATTAPAPAFGASTSFAFGGGNTSTGLFGANNASTGLFGGTQANTGFGAKPAGFGFGGTTTNTQSSGGLFGNTPSTGTGLFGQQTNALTGGGGLFSNTAGGFGQAQQASGTAHAKYNPVVGTDVIVKSGTSQNINIKHHCITCMKEYEGKSLEELRLEDYTAGRKGSTTGVFAFQQQENKPMFPQATPGFGQTATTTASSVFGGGGLTTGGFGQNNAFSFGGNTAANTNTTGLFGANKPAFGATPATGTGLFGATASTQAPAFGTTNTSTFGFGSNLQNQPSGGLFGAKPATSVFGAAPASTGFSSFGGTPSLFQAKPLQTQAPTFGPTPGVGTLAGGFGTNTSTSGLFGGNTGFGKPATTAPAFGFSQPTVGLNTGLGTNTFQAKPTTGFGTLGGGMFNQQPANNTFRTGLDSGLGGGIFGNNSALGGGSLGLGMSANNTALTNSTLGASAAGNVHEQILTLAARPYGDSPLFKDLLPDSSTTAEEVLKPTNPAAMSAVLERSTYRVSPATGTSLQLRIDARHHADKKSLFDGLEESDPSLEDKLTLKPSRKRLVLRPKQTTEQEYSHNNSRSQDDTPRNGTANDQQIDKENSQRADEIDRARKNLDFPDGHSTNNLDITNDRQGSWLSSSKLPWNDKEKPIDNEPTPRLYPNLDKELPVESDRRASWLTTKPLRKPLTTAGDQENSVQELGVRTSHVFSVSQDKENVDTLSVSEDENVLPVEAPPHPTGVRLTRPGYYTIPSLDEMINYMQSDGTCVVPHLTIGRTNYGNVYYDTEIDVAGLDLDSLVHFLNKEVIIYTEDADKPPIGSGLNRRAIVTLDRIWPRDKTDRTHITDPDRLLKMDYEGKLRRVCDKHDTKFIEYRPQTGSWVFRVEHFSKYGLTDSDEEDDVTPDVLKRQLVNQSLQKNAAPANIPPLAPVVGLGGLGVCGLANMSVGGLAGLASVSNMPLDTRPMRALGAQPGFEMDTTEDNTESQSLYQDSKVYGVKSPTTELARLENRQSHHVQLMKASLYADTAMEDDVSVSTGDQLVPLSTQHIPMDLLTEHAPCIPLISQDDGIIEDMSSEESQLKPLIVKPHTIVLKYHRKIPPFKHTIAGRMNASCIADMSVSRARHARAGFGPGSTIAYITTFNSLADNDRDADLSELNRYVIGRGDDDWSEPIVARLAINEPDVTYNIPEFLSKNLQVVYKYSTLVPTEGDMCPRLQLVQSPRERRQALNEIIENAASVRECTPKFGVSGAYCYQVFRLCDALWGDDLENDGIPGTDDLSIVTRYRKFLAWMTTAVSDVTDKQLAHPIQPENEDECDHHSARIWTLLLGGRLLDACKVAKENGDLNMAALMAQAAGESSFRSLISRQLSVYRECGASTLMSKHRIAALELISGTPPMEHLVETHWLTALHATARYLCTQVPSLEQIVSKYTSLFSEDVESGDLSRVTTDGMGMNLPTPPYTERLDVFSEETKRRTLDLRYELIRARAFNARPRLAPEHYTEDPFDYSICVILGVWFGSADPGCILSAADQLQPQHWHNAVLVLMYLQDDRLRTHLIQDVLSRHVPAKVDTPELRSRLEFIKKLGVPDKWVYLAQAHRAKYEHLPQLEAEYLVGAEQWNAAHKVLIDELLPNAVLSDNLQSISNLLEKLNEAAKRHEIHGWESGGRALYNYIHVCSEIRSLLRHGDEDVPGRLEALRPAVAAAVQATRYLPTDSPLAVAGRVELAARALNLVRAAGAGPAQAAALLHALKLPPDTNAHTQHQITMDLAEQASELCIESVTSSPVSSHHRATAAS